MRVQFAILQAVCCAILASSCNGLPVSSQTTTFSSPISLHAAPASTPEPTANTLPRPHPIGPEKPFPITSSTPLPSSTPSAAPIASPLPSPVNQWTFNETSGTTAPDSAGSASGTLSSGASWSTGEIGGAVSVGSNGFSNQATAPVTFPTNLPNTFTLSFWVMANSYGSQENNIILAGDQYLKSGFRSYFSPSGMFIFRTNLSGGTLFLSDTSATPIGTWTHFAVTYQSGSGALYRNGIAVANSLGTYVSGTSNMGIGTNVGSSIPFWGSMGDLRIYNQALSGAQIGNLYLSYNLAHWWTFNETSGTAAPDSAGSSPGTLSNGASWSTSEIGGAVSVGSSDYSSSSQVTFPTNLPNTFTLSFWVMANGFGNIAQRESNIVLAGDQYLKNGFRIEFLPSGLFVFRTNLSGGTLFLSDTSATSIGTWTHFAVTYQNGSAALYRNGILVANSSGTYIPGTSNMGIGASVGLSNPFWGSVSDLRVYNRSFTANEIANSYVIDAATTSFGSQMQSILSPPNAPVSITDTFFGMTIQNLTQYNTFSEPTTPFPDFEVPTFRFWDVAKWAQVEPSSGTYDWRNMDGIIAIGKSNGIKDYVFTFGDIPAWAIASPAPSSNLACANAAGACNPPDMNAFDEFATTLVKRYCGTIKYYETWNEPNWVNSATPRSFWHGNNAQLLAIAKDLYRIAKDPANCGCTNGVCSPGGGTNPNQVLLPSISTIDTASLAWLDTYLAAAGSQYPYADIAAFHGYNETNPEHIISDVVLLRKTLAAHGLSGLDLWDTEASWGGDNLMTTDQQASWLMRFHVAQAVAGVSRFIWYAYDSCGYGTLWTPGYWNGACAKPQGPASTITAPGEAYPVIESWLIGATVTRCNQYQNGLWACELQRPGGYDGWMLWSSSGAVVTVPTPSSLKFYRNWQNNVNPLSGTISVSGMPVLLETQNCPL